MPKPESVAKRTAMGLLIWFLLVIAAASIFIFWPTSLARELGRHMDLFGRTDSAFYPLWALLCALVAGFVAVAIHETAHALVGVAAGFRFNSLRIGRVQFDRPFRFSLYRGRQRPVLDKPRCYRMKVRKTGLSPDWWSGRANSNKVFPNPAVRKCNTSANVYNHEV